MHVSYAAAIWALTSKAAWFITYVYALKGGNILRHEICSNKLLVYFFHEWEVHNSFSMPIGYTVKQKMNKKEKVDVKK